MIDAFRECRERVSAQDAARHYGLTFDRKGWAVCPFHSDKHPSMSFRNGRFRCWACGASGDSVDFAARFFRLEPLAAVEKINADFALSLPLRRKPTAAEEAAARRREEIALAHKQFEEWRKALICKLCEAYRLAHAAKMRGAPFAAGEALAIKWQSDFEYLADTLEIGTPEEQAQLYKERGQIARWIEKVLSS